MLWVVDGEGGIKGGLVMVGYRWRRRWTARENEGMVVVEGQRKVGGVVGEVRSEEWAVCEWKERCGGS